LADNSVVVNDDENCAFLIPLEEWVPPSPPPALKQDFNDDALRVPLLLLLLLLPLRFLLLRSDDRDRRRLFNDTSPQLCDRFKMV
jgi:hypothetical protein